MVIIFHSPQTQILAHYL